MSSDNGGFMAALRRRLNRGGVRYGLPLLQRGLLSDTFRSLVVAELEKYLISGDEAFANSRLPPQVRQDKKDMACALLRSVERALQRKQLSRQVLGRLLEVFLVNTTLRQDQASMEAREAFASRHGGQGPPSILVVSPTKTCNLRCSGCYANSDAGRGEHLDWDVFDRIITEAKSLWGIRFFTISGGEPLAYRSRGKDLLDMAGKHGECFFLMYTNATLIDARTAERLAETANLSPAISVEGFQARTDARRGAGVFQRILEAMARLRQAGVPFGISLTATRDNAEEILSDRFIDFFFEDQQAIFGWLFQYMPIGRSYTLDSLVTPRQRLWMWQRTWSIVRERKILLADFWNCGTVSDGCIAAGQGHGGGYLYIDWNGRVFPCVFVPYAAANIHEVYRSGATLDAVYELPYLRAIRQWQCEYALDQKRPEECGNLLLPCSLRDHFDVGRKLIEKHHPEPGDEAAADALGDASYYDGMLAYDRQLRDVFDPVWEQQYVHAQLGQEDGAKV
jgi:MoaA/NifB/PqqE/SkfB family radical SAM enzyme